MRVALRERVGDKPVSAEGYAEWPEQIGIVFETATSFDTPRLMTELILRLLDQQKRRLAVKVEREKLIVAALPNRIRPGGQSSRYNTIEQERNRRSMHKTKKQAKPSLSELADRASDLRSTLGTMALEGQYLDAWSLAIYGRYVRGEIDLDTVGRLFDKVIYSHNPSARIDP